MAEQAAQAQQNRNLHSLQVASSSSNGHATMNGHAINHLDQDESNSDAYLISFYVMKSRLEREHYDWPECPELPADPSRTCIVMRELAANFESRRPQELSALAQALDMSPRTAYSTFLDIANGIFLDGINWGRIVALYAFGGILAKKCIAQNMERLLPNIADWIAIYTEAHLDRWISEHGGWDGMVEFYEQRNRLNGYRSFSLFTNHKVMAGVGVACALVGVVTLGAVLSHR